MAEDADRASPSPPPATPADDAAAKMWADAATCKERGNGRFALGDFQGALYEYAKGLELIKAARARVDPAAAAATPTMWDPSSGGPAIHDPSAPLHRETDPVRLKLEVDLRGNIAQSCLSLERYGQCLEECRHVLTLDPANDKAVYRSAKAYLGLGEVERAEGLLEDLQERHSTNATATAMLVQIRAKKQAKAAAAKSSGAAAAAASEAAAPAASAKAPPAAATSSTTSSTSGTGSDLASAMKRAMKTGGLYADAPGYDKPLPPPLPKTKVGAVVAILKEMLSMACMLCPRRGKPADKAA